MNIIIVGLGKIGTTMTKQLVAEGHDVTVIDINHDTVVSTVDACDVMGICGNGASREILEEAGAAKAKLIIAATPSDELNILSCLMAKKIGTEHTIARVRNPDYANQNQFLRDELGINMVVNPEFETANEISRIIRFPSAAHLDSFARGKIEIASIRIHSDNPLCGLPIYDLRKKTRAKVLICAIQRDDEVFIPSGDFVIKCDDVISITGSRSELTSFMRQCGVYKHKVNNVMIIGGGRIGYYLAKLLSDTGRSIKLIEQNEEKCYSLCDSLPDVTVIHGDGTEQEILDEQHIENQDALVALTGIDEENIILSMYAESKRWQIEISNANETELGGYKEISFMIEGDGAYSKLKFESGVHRVQRVPETESQGRIHTSTVTVAVLPEMEDVEVEINQADLKIETCKSSGAGGQHINKTESAIRIYHLPTGIVVECQDERSQHKNKDKAMKMLKTKLLDMEREKQQNAIASERRSQVGSGDRSERIRTYNYPQGRLTDHRINLTLYSLETILDGRLDDVIDALITADRAEKLQNSQV